MLPRPGLTIPYHTDPMTQIQGQAVTADPARVMKRLCRHWSHKFQVHFDDLTGDIQINEVRLAMRAEADRLDLLLENPGGEVPSRLPQVVTDHLVRMAGPDTPIEVRWQQGESTAESPASS